MKEENLIILGVLAVAALYLFNKNRSSVALVPVNVPTSQAGATGSQIGQDAGDLYADIAGLFH